MFEDLYELNSSASNQSRKVDLPANVCAAPGKNLIGLDWESSWVPSNISSLLLTHWLSSSKPPGPSPVDVVRELSGTTQLVANGHLLAVKLD